MRTILNRLLALAAVAVLAIAAVMAAPTAAGAQSFDSPQPEKIRKELVTLPYYGVFDNLAYEVNGQTVTLYGQVRHPSTRTSAEKRVARIEGVERVINNIEVLPLSPSDDRIRRRVYREIFNTGGLHRYAMGANPSLHIIVKRGHVTLEGVVATDHDRQLAYMAASRVPGTFTVTNNLRSEQSEGELY